jgi:hypothetical protein
MRNDPSLSDRFLRGEIDNTTFRHADHVLVGFELLKIHDFSTASHKFSSALKTIAARAGKPGAYHETITLAFLSLIAERSTLRHYENFEDFVQANPDLMDKAILQRWYAPERLHSDVARQIFVLPEAAR